MSTYSVQTRVFTPESTVVGQTVYGGTTTYDVIVAKDLNIPLGLTAGKVLPTLGGTATFGQVYNQNFYQPAVIGNRQKLFFIATADETNTEDIAVYSFASATGTAGLTGHESKIATLGAGDSVIFPFRADTAVTSRNLIPNILVCNATAGTPATTPSLHIAIGYNS
jgi:hypothetical protein